MTEAQTKAQFSDEFLNANPEKFGSADMTLQEFSSLRSLYTQHLKEEYGSDFKYGDLSRKEKDQIKQNVINNIIQQGWPSKDKENISTSEYVDSAINHACVVAISLLEDRGESSIPSTHQSYIWKNQADRFIQKHIPKKLIDEWNSPQNRDSNYNPEEQGFRRVDYPNKVDLSKIHGISKPNRYLPAQLLRIIEEIRLDTASTPRFESLGISDQNDKEYLINNIGIKWSEYTKSIQDANSINEVAALIATNTIRVLKDRGVKPEIISKLILSGYDPKGPIKEHGHIKQVKEIWNALLKQVQANPDISEFHEPLKSGYEEACKKVNYDPNL